MKSCLKIIQISCKEIYFALIVFLIGFTSCNSHKENWTHFRGDNLNGIALTDAVPLNWSESDIKWKTEIHDRGWSSPVVYNNQVWVTLPKLMAGLFMHYVLILKQGK